MHHTAINVWPCSQQPGWIIAFYMGSHQCQVGVEQSLYSTVSLMINADMAKTALTWSHQTTSSKTSAITTKCWPMMKDKEHLNKHERRTNIIVGFCFLASHISSDVSIFNAMVKHPLSLLNCILRKNKELPQQPLWHWGGKLRTKTPGNQLMLCADIHRSQNIMMDLRLMLVTTQPCILSTS